MLPLLVLQLLCLGQIAALSLPNGTMLSGDGNAASNVNLPTLGGAGLGIVNGSLGSGGVNSGGASSPGGGGNVGGGGSGSQSNQELNAGGNTLGAGAGGSGAGGGGAGAAGSSNNSALLQAPKEKQYERCTGPGDPGPCKQYIYKWRYEPSTSECTTFIWGGCDGNPHNRFSTEAECLYHCIGGPRKRIIVVNQKSISYQKCAFPSLLLFSFLLQTLYRHFCSLPHASQAPQNPRWPATRQVRHNCQLAMVALEEALAVVGMAVAGVMAVAPRRCPSSNVDPS